MENNYHWKPQLMTLIDHPSTLFNSMTTQKGKNIDEEHQIMISSKMPMLNFFYEDGNMTSNENDYLDDSQIKNSKSLNNSCTDELISTSSSKSLSQRKKFSPEEDIKLRRLIAINGPKKWDQIALSMPGRTGRQCRDRFHNYLNPMLINGPWSREEDILLEQKVSEIGQHWNKISKFFNGRSSNNIKNRWHTYIRRDKKDKYHSAFNRNIIKNCQIQGYHLQKDNLVNHYSFDFIGNNYHQKNSVTDNINNLEKLSSKNALDIINNNNNNQNIKLEKKYKNEMKTLFPPICPPNDSFFLPLNQGILSFLSAK